ncbi:MAG: GtrA family protein [Candidatus Marinimicrobia bacterium]|nr:GtrA family protein [Candidatus Neomarinimicrobiota bacterium]
MIKKDYLIAIIVGFVTTLFLLPSLTNMKLVGENNFLIMALFVIIPLCWVIGLFLGEVLGKWLSFFRQFAKFVIVGFLNSAIDFGVLNFLSIMTGLTSGFLVGGVNVPGFTLAAINSYFWQKFWVFRKEKVAGEKTNYSDFITFSAVVLVGIFVNGSIVILLTTFMHPLWGLSPERWLNASKVVATAVSLIWNFLGFKFLVFKTKSK